MELVSALAGAIVGGLLTIFATGLQARSERKRRTEAVKAAICAEIASLVETARRNNYEIELRHLAAQTAAHAGNAPLPRFRVATGAPAFTVYEANANVIGDLPAKYAADIVFFYQKASSWLLSAAFVTSIDLGLGDKDNLTAYYETLADHLASLVHAGDSLVAQLAPSELISHIVATSRAIESFPTQHASDSRVAD